MAELSKFTCKKANRVLDFCEINLMSNSGLEFHHFGFPQNESKSLSLCN
jgi:hypothetical protein